jgi:hypothetical protein
MKCREGLVVVWARGRKRLRLCVVAFLETLLFLFCINTFEINNLKKNHPPYQPKKKHLSHLIV